MTELLVEDGPEAVAKTAAALLSQHVERVSRSAGRFTLALAGGTTPRRTYELLAARELPWRLLHFFWSDERHVPPDHPESNFGMAREVLLAKAPIPGENVHRIRAETADARAAAAEYTAELRTFFDLGPGELPQLDLILLGMGADAHTASLFPGSDVLFDRTHLVAAPWVEKFQSYRITLTPPVLQAGAVVVVLVTGAEKAAALQAVLEGDKTPDVYPARLLLEAKGRVIWLVDENAARLLKKRSRLGG